MSYHIEDWWYVPVRKVERGGTVTKHECQTCRYFDREIFNPAEDCTSWCVRYPPVYVGPRVDTLTPEGPFCEPNQAHYWEYPTVGICSCCGEWRECEE